MEKDVCLITLFDIKTKYQSRNEISVVLDDDSDEFIFVLATEKLQIKCQHYNYFSAFQTFRDELLSKGYGIKCNGAKINAVQSPMMANTCKIYLVKLGRQALAKDIVNLWDYAEIEMFPDTKEQHTFFDKWKNSI